MVAPSDYAGCAVGWRSPIIRQPALRCTRRHLYTTLSGGMLQCWTPHKHPERSSVMQAIVIVSSADGGTLEYRDVPDPTPRPGELLVRVRATGLNRADLAQRRGAYPRPATGG